MTLYIQEVATEDRCTIHEQWKGRIDQWQPRRRQRRRKRNTRSRIQKGKWGTRKASPKFLGKTFTLHLPRKKSFRATPVFTRSETRRRSKRAEQTSPGHKGRLVTRG